MKCTFILQSKVRNVVSIRFFFDLVLMFAAMRMFASILTHWKPFRIHQHRIGDVCARNCIFCSFFYLFAMQMINWERNVSLDQYCEEKFAEIKMQRKKRERERELDRKRKNHCMRISASLDTIRHRLSFNRNSQDDVFELFTLYKFNARANLCKNLYINYQVP